MQTFHTFDSRHILLTSVLTIALFALLTPMSSAAQETQEAAEEAANGPWTAEAEVTLVATSGNSEASTIGVGGHAERAWDQHTLIFDLSALSADTTTTTRRAVATPNGFDLVEDSESETTAENFAISTRYDRALDEHRSVFGQLSWERNEFAGYRSRLVAAVGFSWTKIDTDDHLLRFDVGPTWTREEDLRGDEDDFAGLLLGMEARRRLSATTLWSSKLSIHPNLDDTDDSRAVFDNSLQVSMTDALALKIGLELKYENQPALVSVALENPNGTLTGSEVLVELDELDSTFIAALVVTF